jgi:hypothetical protein
MCADVLKSIEKRLADAGVQHPPLKIVPKNLSSGYQVVGTCEGGSQRQPESSTSPISVACRKAPLPFVV